MNHIYKDSMKTFLHREMLKTMDELDLTKERTAEMLCIDTRSFAYLKSGKTMFSATTLLLYLARICPDYKDFMKKLKSVLKEAEQN